MDSHVPIISLSDPHSVLSSVLPLMLPLPTDYLEQASDIVSFQP